MRAQLITCSVIFITWGALLFFELRHPLRRTVEPKLRRTGRNLTLSVFSLLAGIGMEAVLVIPIARWTEANQAGLLNLFDAPAWVEIAIAIVLLDYTLWWWHWASHRVPFLWRFHLVHHIDRDLDAMHEMKAPEKR